MRPPVRLGEEHARRVQRFFPSERFGEVLAVGSAGIGLSGARVGVVTTARGEFVLRVQGGDHRAWKRSVAMQRLAAAEGIAPEVVHVDEDEAASVSVKVAGVSFDMAAAQPSARPAAFASLVQMVSKLHAVPVTEAMVRPIDTPALARSIWASQIGRPGFPAWGLELGPRLATACAMLERDGRRVFSHNDLHPSNVLWDGNRVWLFDWERAGSAASCTVRSSSASSLI